MSDQVDAGPGGVLRGAAVPAWPAQARRRRGGERSMVPEAEFTSYYGRKIVKPSPWEADIPAYLFTGGLAAGSSLLAAGADLTGRPALRRTGRLGALGALGFSMVALVHDLGRPSRFLNMLRTVKLDLADVGRHLDPLDLRPVRRARRRPPRCADLLPAGARRGPAAGCSSAVGRPAGVIAAADRPAGRGLHRGAALRHRHPVLARGLQGAAVRLRRARRPRPPAGWA